MTRRSLPVLVLALLAAPPLDAQAPTCLASTGVVASPESVFVTTVTRCPVVRDTFVRVDTVRSVDTVPAPVPPDTATPPPAPEPEPPPSGTNEPSGLTRLAEWTASPLPPLSSSVTWSSGENLGRWTRFEYSGRLIAGTERGAPGGDDKVFDTTYPDGMREGTEPVEVGAWGTSTAPVKRFYWRAWVKYLPNAGTWESHPAGIKAGFFGYGCGAADNDAYFWLPTGGGSRFVTSWRWELKQQNGTYGTYATTGRIVVGKWQLWEMYAEINTPDQYNGKLTLWLDGEQVGSWSNVRWRKSTCTYSTGFRRFKWRNTWGGNSTGAVKTRTDAVRVGHIYMSGGN